MEGTVKWFNRKKGFGFVTGDDGQEYFVHYSAVPQGTFLRDNDKISFDPAETEKGKQAQNVQLLQKGSERTDLPQEEEQPVEETKDEVEETPAEETENVEKPAEEEAPAEENLEE